MSNKLVEILPSDWIELRAKFLPNWPKDIVGYSIVDNYINWWKQDKNIKNLHFYCLNGDWKSDGTFIVIDRYQLFIYSLSKQSERLRIIFSLLDWTNGFKVSSFIHRNRQPLIDYVDSKQLQKEYDSLCYLYYYPKQDAAKLKLDLPSGITLRQMSIEHAKIVNEIWPNKHDASLFLLTRLIQWNVNIGAFDEDGNLVAWCLRLQSGALGALQVIESHYRLGLGTIVTIAMIKLLAEMNLDTFGYVGHQNYASQKMFEKIGFKIIDNVHWVRTYPNTWNKD